MADVTIPADAGPVIRIDGICYERVGPEPGSSTTNEMSDIDGRFEDCEECYIENSSSSEGLVDFSSSSSSSDSSSSSSESGPPTIDPTKYYCARFTFYSDACVTPLNPIFFPPVDQCSLGQDIIDFYGDWGGCDELGGPPSGVTYLSGPYDASNCDGNC